MYLQQRMLGVPASPVEASEAMEKVQRKEMERNCKDVNVLDWLERDGPGSLREYIAHLERRLTATPRLVAGHAQLSKLKAMRLPRDKFEKARRGILTAFPEMKVYTFPHGYNVRSVKDELAQVRCKLSRARLNFQIWNRTGQRPKGAGFLRLCSSPPGRPLTFWTLSGFAPNDTALSQSQLAEIELIARALASNPRTRSGMPVLTITGRFAPGENPRVGDGRAIAVKNALADVLKRIDQSLLLYVGFNLASEAWCGEVAISMRERNAPLSPLPNLRLSPTSPLVQPGHPLAPTGTPLPSGSVSKPPSGRSAQDIFREKVDGILRKYGVESMAARKAIADSAVFQGEQAIRSAVGKAGLSFRAQQSILEEILALRRR